MIGVTSVSKTSSCRAWGLWWDVSNWISWPFSQVQTYAVVNENPVPPGVRDSMLPASNFCRIANWKKVKTCRNENNTMVNIRRMPDSGGDVLGWIPVEQFRDTRRTSVEILSKSKHVVGNRAPLPRRSTAAQGEIWREVEHQGEIFHASWSVFL